MSNGDHLTRNRGAIRFLLLALGVPQALIGLWALLRPPVLLRRLPGRHRRLGQGARSLRRASRDRRGRALRRARGGAGGGGLQPAPRRRGGGHVRRLVFSVPHFLWHVFNLDRTDRGRGGQHAVARLDRDRRRADPGADEGPAREALHAHEQGPRIEGVPDTRAGLLARAPTATRGASSARCPTPCACTPITPPCSPATPGSSTRRRGRTACRRAQAAGRHQGRRALGLRVLHGHRLDALRQGGITEEQLRALPEYADSPLFSDDEKLVLDLAAGMTATPVNVPDELFARLRERFDDAQLVELASEIAVENYRGRFDRASASARRGSALVGSARCRSPPPRAAPPP